MNNLIVISGRLVLAVTLLFSSALFAQKSYKESFKVNSDVLVSVNTSQVNVVFETWDKNAVEVEAYVNGDLSEKERKEIFDEWDFDVLGNSNKVVITSNATSAWKGLGSLSKLEALEELGNMPILEKLKDFDFGDMNFNIDVPDIPEMEDFPNWPFTKEGPNSIFGGDSMNFKFDNKSHISFDTDEYEKDKQGYVNKLNKKYDTNISVRQVDGWLEDLEEWSDGFSETMEKWGENFGKEWEMKFGPEWEAKMEAWGENLEKEMEVWGEKFGKEMEAWGEEFGKGIEEWAEQFAEDAEEWADKYDEDGDGNIIIKDGKHKGNSRANKTIIIRMPKGTKTEINVRHGEVKMADATNLKATLNYAQFTANSIDGGETLINAAYAPVRVNNWVQGTLFVNYVDICFLNSVEDINLEANSSDVSINLLRDSAILSGSFGNLLIGSVSEGFETLDISLENTDANIKIPKTAFSFYFNGKKSKIDSPSSLQLTESNNRDRALLKGYNLSKGSSKSITINSSYSNITLHQ